ncbi:hypothetical protein O1M54_48985 [Streptomyces diastatochromogenes]|nr:hypothetical protein [Streptomyces diastatochromogenes]
MCVSGTGALARTLTAVARGQAGDEAADKLHRWSRQLPGRGPAGCSTPPPASSPPCSPTSPTTSTPTAALAAPPARGGT